MRGSGVKVGDGVESAAADGLPFDDAEPHLDEVEPGRGGRGEVHVHSWDWRSASAPRHGCTP